jgi:hypothetical protein
MYYVENFKMWCWRRLEKINWTDGVKNEVLHRVKYRKTLHTVKRRKANWISHILHRKCLLKHIEGKMEGRMEMMEDQEEDVSNY